MDGSGVAVMSHYIGLQYKLIQIKGFTIKIKSECLQTLLDSSVGLVYKTVQIKMLAFSFCTHFEPWSNRDSYQMTSVNVLSFWKMYSERIVIEVPNY